MKFFNFLEHIYRKHGLTALMLLFIFIFSVYVKSFAADAPGGDGFYAGETLNPSCTPGSANCSITALINSGTDLYYTGGNVGIGTSTPGALLDVNGIAIFRSAPSFREVSPELITTTTLGYVVTSYDSTAGGGGGQNVWRRADGTEATPTNIKNNMYLGSLSFRGYDGSAFTGSKGFMAFRAAEDWTATANGTQFEIYTTPTGTSTINTNPGLFVSNGNNVGIGTTSPSSILHTVATTETDMASRIINDTYSTAQLSGMIGRRARGTSSSPTAVQSGDYLIAIAGRGYGATGFPSASTGSFNIQATENFTDSAMGTKATIRTTDNGSTTQSDKVTVLGNGNVGIGVTAPVHKLQISDDTNADLVMETSGSSDNSAFWILKSRGTVASREIVQSSDGIGGMRFLGYDGSAFQSAALISGSVDGTPGATDMPGRIVFSTTPDGSGTSVERMRITNAGYVGIGTTSPQRALHISDTMRLEPRASAPSSPSAGDIYVDSTTANELCYYDGSAWQGISSGTDASCS